MIFSENRYPLFGIMLCCRKDYEVLLPSPPPIGGAEPPIGAAAGAGFGAARLAAFFAVFFFFAATTFFFFGAAFLALLFDFLVFDLRFFAMIDLPIFASLGMGDSTAGEINSALRSSPYRHIAAATTGAAAETVPPSIASGAGPPVAQSINSTV
jgi:hypothetical protein